MGAGWRHGLGGVMALIGVCALLLSGIPLAAAPAHGSIHAAITAQHTPCGACATHPAGAPCDAPGCVTGQLLPAEPPAIGAGEARVGRFVHGPIPLPDGHGALPPAPPPRGEG